MRGLRCESCGLVYEERAVARHLDLTATTTCRRCGGDLEPYEERPAPRDRPVVVAVRSAVTGSARLPFG